MINENPLYKYKGKNQSKTKVLNLDFALVYRRIAAGNWRKLTKGGETDLAPNLFRKKHRKGFALGFCAQA